MPTLKQKDLVEINERLGQTPCSECSKFAFVITGKINKAMFVAHLCLFCRDWGFGTGVPEETVSEIKRFVRFKVLGEVDTLDLS